MGESIVIVGAGLAGGKAAQTLREEGFDGDLSIVGSEPERPYERPPLSKGYLQGSDERESVFVHPTGWYDENRVELITSTTATSSVPTPGRWSCPTAGSSRTAACCSPPARAPDCWTCPARTSRGSGTCGPWPTRKRCAMPWLRQRGSRSSGAAGSGPRWRRPRERWTCRSASSRWPRCRCCGCSARPSPASSPTCTRITASPFERVQQSVGWWVRTGG